MSAVRISLACLALCAASCAATASRADVSDADAIDALDGPADARSDVADVSVDRAPIDVHVQREDAATEPRCYAVRGAGAVLEHVASIPRESWALSNGASGCVGDVDNDGVREFVLLRMNEPSELIGADFCSRGRVLLPDNARDCMIADVDGVAGNELIVTSSYGWTQPSVVYVGAVRASRADDRTIERFMFNASATLDDRRPVSPVGAPHVVRADLDGDGAIELAVSGNYASSFARVWSRADGSWRSILEQDLRTTMDETHGWLVGDIDDDGDDEALLLPNCGTAGRHVLRQFDRWTSAPIDTLVTGPMHATFAELDGAPPRELLSVERPFCNGQSTTPTLSLFARRFDATSRQWTTLATLARQRPPSELHYVAAMDLDRDGRDELVQCSTPLGAGANTPRTCRAYVFAAAARTFTAFPSAAAPWTWTSEPHRSILSRIAAEDLDGDGRVELFLMGQDHVDVLRGPPR